MQNGCHGELGLQCQQFLRLRGYRWLASSWCQVPERAVPERQTGQISRARMALGRVDTHPALLQAENPADLSQVSGLWSQVDMKEKVY